MPTTWRPIVEKLYKKQEDIRAALKRHLVFFNTQPGVGGVIHGIVIAMEEERAAGADISGDAINGIKTGLMGPMAGIGDTLQRGIVIPIALRAGHRHRHRRRCRDGGAGEHPGPRSSTRSRGGLHLGRGLVGLVAGICAGRRAAVTSILRTGACRAHHSGSRGAGQLHHGALAVQFVRLSTPVAFMVGGSTFRLQAILDSLMPNLLPLLLVLLVWWLVAGRTYLPRR